MPSPFPGMNPYLEQADCWEDFHQSYMKELRDRIADKAGPEYIVKLETNIYSHELRDETFRLARKSDIGISHAGTKGPEGTQTPIAELPARRKVSSASSRM